MNTMTQQMSSNNCNNQYSVLMSVYRKEKADCLKTAMESIWNQTVLPDDFVLVCDGPLTAELDAVIEEMGKKHPETLQVVRLKQNGGLGNALNIGIKYCKNELVARMDSDDISRPDRCEQQLQIMTSMPDVAIVGGIVEEFDVSTGVINARRVTPEKHSDILKFAKKRNPFNHPCVMYRKSAVEDSGGYQDMYLLEDYYLWVRILQKGYKGYNLQTPLLWMRAGNSMYSRRSGWRYAKSQKQLFGYMKRSGMITNTSYIASVLIRSASSLAPNSLRKAAFKTVLRK